MPELNIGVPTMGEVEVADNGSLVFELQGSLTFYEHLVSECGFYIGTDASMEGAAKYPCKLTGKTFSTTLTLEGYNRKYYVCSYITDGRSEILSKQKIINVGPLDDYVSFGIISLDSYSVELESALFSTTCTAKEGVEIGTYGILYGISSDLAKSGTAKALKFPSVNESAIFTLKDFKVGTKYYICQYLTDNGTTAYGATVDFDVYVLPTVTIGDITDITASSATVSGTVTAEGGTVILEKGIVYAEGTTTPTVETGKVQSMGLNQDISVTLSNLSPNTRYTVRAYAINSEGPAYSAESKTFTTLVALPQVNTGDASSVTSTTAVLNGKIVDDGGETPSECGFYWSTTKFSTPSAATRVASTVSGSTFSSQLSNLTRAQTYYYQAYSRNSAGESYGEVLSFTALQTLPVVTTSGITEITDTGAICGGTVVDDGGASITKRGVVWSTSPAPTVSLSTKTEDGFGTGSYTSTLTGLTRATKYYVRAYATSSKGTSYGEQKSFTTKVSKSTVSTRPASSVTSTTAVLNGKIIDDGGETPSECGFYWSTTKFSTPSAATRVASTVSGSTFSSQLSNLTRAQTYYYQAYSRNSAGESYGEVLSFTALQTLPVVTTSGITEITDTGAICGGTVVDDGGASITKRGVVWSTSPDPTVSLSTKTEDGSGTGSYTSTLTGLTRATKYYVRAYATSSKGTSYGEQKSFTTRVSKSTVSTQPASSVTSTTAVLNGKIVDDGGETPSECGFYWSTTKFSTPSAATRVASTVSGSTFSSKLSNLTRAQTYYYQAYSRNSAGESYGEVLSFTALQTLPVVTTSGITEITDTGAICGGTVVDDGGASITKRGVVWSTSPDPTVSLSTKTEDGSGTGSYTSMLTGLTRATKYYVRAYATSSKGTSYGEQKSFTTKVSKSTVSTHPASSVTSTTAVLNGKIVDDGGETPSECGFYWSATVFTDPSAANKIKGTLSGSSFSANLTGLSYMTSYFYQAYVITSAGISYGDTQPFATTAALPTVTTAEVTDIGNDGATSGGEVTDDGGALVTKRGVVWSTEPNPTVSLVTRTEDGSGKGSFTSAVTGLTLGTTYYLRAYATNQLGTSYGEERTFKTPVLLSTVMTESATDITSASAVLNATLVFNGGEVPSDCGFYWSESQFSDNSTAIKLVATLSGTSFSAKLANLKRSTTYYFQAYSKNSAGISCGQIRSFKTSAELPKVTTASISDITSNSATGGGSVTDDGGASITQRGVVWSTKPSPTVSLSTKTEDGPGADSFTSTMTGLTRATKYYVRAYAVNEAGSSYGDERTFITHASKATVTTLPVTSLLSPSPELNARIDDDGGLGILEAGFYWSDAPLSETSGATKIISSISGNTLQSQLINLAAGTTYYYQAYAINSLGISYGEEISFIFPFDLSSSASANCYIVSESGAYKFKTVQGNSSTSVGSVSSCEVLWESFGTATTPSRGDLIKSVSYSDGCIGFETATTFREGNAVIAAKDASGTILWSWHIWITDQPQGQIYNNGAGVMMDRNLGATSATKGDSGVSGLLYQWGRKDPFLGSSSTSGNTYAKSTITWPSSVSSSSKTGTVAYATAHPTTFITYNSNNYDWYYTTSISTDDTRWQSNKTIYDPCPVGWRVPDGGYSGVWVKAFGTSSAWQTSYNWDSTYKGMDFSKTDNQLGPSGPIWYPAFGFRSSSGSLYNVGSCGNYWSVTPNSHNAFTLYFDSRGNVYPVYHDYRSGGRSVRCLKE